MGRLVAGFRAKLFLPFLLTWVNVAGATTPDNCSKCFTKLDDTLVAPRAGITHVTHPGLVWESDPQREKDIELSIKHMTDEHNGVFAGHPDTPPMVVVPTSDTKIKFTRPWQEYSPMIADVYAPDANLRATVLLPVSAHTGLENAKKWATTDTYTLAYIDSSGKQVPLATQTRSLGMITAHEVEIPLEDGKPVHLIYNRSGSGGVGGYSGGRDLVLTWHKGQVDATPTDYSHPFWIVPKKP